MQWDNRSFSVTINIFFFSIILRCFVYCTPPSGRWSAHFVISSNGPAPSETHMVGGNENDGDHHDHGR